MLHVVFDQITLTGAFTALFQPSATKSRDHVYQSLPSIMVLTLTAPASR
jgi:hypothetical protein